MQEAALTWCIEVAGGRHHRSLDGAQPYAVFQALEAPVLRPLPMAPFELARWSNPKVGTDCHAKVGKVLYSLPWRLIGQRLDARETEQIVEFFVDGTLVRTWVRDGKRKQTNWDDYPPEKVAFFMRTPVWCRKRAVELGRSVAEVVEDLLGNAALHRLRSAQGVIGLADRYGATRLDAACARAIVVGDPSYRTIKGILVAGTEEDGAPTGSVPMAPAHLHGPVSLFDTGTDGS